jgi:hypothetical protein
MSNVNDTIAVSGTAWTEVADTGTAAILSVREKDRLGSLNALTIYYSATEPNAGTVLATAGHTVHPQKDQAFRVGGSGFAKCWARTLPPAGTVTLNRTTIA